MLLEGETVAAFIEASVRESIERHRASSEFPACGLMSRDEAMRTGVYRPADMVHVELSQMLAKAAVPKQANLIDGQGLPGERGVS